MGAGGVAGAAGRAVLRNATGGLDGCSGGVATGGLGEGCSGGARRWRLMEWALMALTAPGGD